PTSATTTTASRLAPRAITNVPAMGQVSTLASTLRAAAIGLPQSAVGGAFQGVATGGGGLAASRTTPGPTRAHSSQPVTGVRQEQVDPPAVGDQVVVDGAARRVLLLDVAHHPLEVH